MFLYMLMPGHLIPANSITVYIYHRYRNSIDGEQWTSFLQFITFISHSHLLLVILAFPLDFRLFQPASIINPRLYSELSDRRTSYVPLTYLQSLLENFRSQQPYVLRVIALRGFCNLVQFFFSESCDDCIKFRSCNAAMDLFRKRDPVANTKLQTQICGHDHEGLPKVNINTNTRSSYLSIHASLCMSHC